jgi:glutathione S-transferase
MSEDLVFYTNPMSRGRIARWMLEEVGRPYRTEIVEYGPEMKSSAYLAINPMGKVPALVHGKTVVTETAAICAYLADAFPEAGLAPAPRDRGDYYRWLFFCAGPFEQAWTNQSFGFALPEGGSRRAGYGSFEQVLDCLEAALAGRDHVAGDRFSAADLYLAAQLGFGLRFGMIDKRPEFVRYVGLHANRPARVRADEIDEPATPPQA